MAVGYLDITATGYAETIDKAILDIAGDLDIISLVAPDIWDTGSNQTIVEKGNAYIHRLSNSVGGKVGFTWNPSTGNIHTVSTDIPGLVAGEPTWLRTVFDASVWAVSHQYSHDPVDTAYGDVTWTEVEQDTGAGPTSIQDTANSLRVGNNAAATLELTGKVHGVWVHDGIPATYTDAPAGSLVADPDWRTDDQGWSGGSGTDSLANSWSLNGDAFWVPPTGRFTGRHVHYDFANKRVVIESGV